jgi:hypothetical protein
MAFKHRQNSFPLLKFHQKKSVKKTMMKMSTRYLWWRSTGWFVRPKSNLQHRMQRSSDERPRGVADGLDPGNRPDSGSENEQNVEKHRVPWFKSIITVSITNSYIISYYIILNHIISCYIYLYIMIMMLVVSPATKLNLHLLPCLGSLFSCRIQAKLPLILGKAPAASEEE